MERVDFGLSKTTTITFDLNAMQRDFEGAGTPGGAETAAHEGTHGVDQRTGAAGRLQVRGIPTWNGTLNLEVRAYTSEAFVDQGLGVRSVSDESPVWDPNWDPARATTNRNLAIVNNAIDNAHLDCQGACIGEPPQ